MTPEKLRDGGVLLLLLLLGFFQFPGHTFLQSDTQIYIPILEHLRDPSTLARDQVATHPHVSYTVYDEAARALRALTGGVDFQAVLVAQQILFRAAGLVAIYWIAGSCGLAGWASLLVTAIYGLGSTVPGPSVLTIEYEPVPRGSALPMALLAMALAARGRHLAAGLAAGIGLLYHPPTVLPVVVIFCLMELRPGITGRRQRLMGLGGVLLAGLLLMVLARLQAGAGESQLLFSRIDPAWEKLLKMRGSYNWITLWGDHWIQQYEFFAIVSLAALWRLRPLIPAPLQFLFGGLTIYGLLSMPLSYWLLERAHWSLMTQLQPARAVLFLSLLASLLPAIAAFHVAQQGKRWQALVWFLFALAPSSQSEALRTLLPDLRHESWQRRAAATLIASLLLSLAAYAWTHRRRWGAPACLAAMLAPFFLIPHLGKVRNYPPLETPPLRDLSAWARRDTDPQAVFLFADADKSLEPGVFRARALRAVYVDWKAGGQVNLLRTFADDWWTRWQQAMGPPFSPSRVPALAALGVDFVVVGPKNRLPERQPVFHNENYLVYKTNRSFAGL